MINQKTVTKGTFMSWHTETLNPFAHQFPPESPMKTIRVWIRTMYINEPFIVFGIRYSVFRTMYSVIDATAKQFAWLAVTQSPQSEAEEKCENSN